MNMSRLIGFSLFTLVLASMASLASMRQGYYRFPAIHGDKIVFTAEGDLWIVGANGGTATRLATSHGTESHAAISPYGSMAAFSGQYEGHTEIYVMPIDGGNPKRLTYEGYGATARSGNKLSETGDPGAPCSNAAATGVSA